MPAPGSLTRAEYATGLLVRSVKVNGYYLLLDNCSLYAIVAGAEQLEVK
jgi:hypothetical protein